MVRSGLSADEALKRAGAGGGPAKTLVLVNEYRDRFAKTPNEIEYTLRALEGRFVPPGSGNDPVRNPSAIPTGRNMYAVNPEQIPTKPAWEVAVALVDKLLKTRKVKKIAFDLNAFETMRDFGVMEAQILYLMGVRPVWDANNLAVDIEVIPREKLGRPRIDAFISISGTMRDNFPSRIQLLDKAARMVSTLDEPDNYVREGTRAREKALLKRNFSAERAGQFAAARIFGQKPGEYGTKILYLVPKSGSWDKEKEIAVIYMENMSYVFTGNAWGEKVEGLYEEAVQGSEMILRTWASNMMSPLSNHHVIEYTGGLNMAVKAITGKDPEIALNDVRDEPRLRNFEDALRVELHATLLNAKWTKGMMENGYAGAGMMAELVKNTFGWKVTRSGSVSDATWNEIHAVYVKDKHSLKLREWMDRMNPHAFQEIAATLLEAHRKGYWSADAATIADLARQYAESVVKYRESGGLVGGGNVRLQKKVSEALQAPGDKPLVEGYKAEVASAKGQPATARVAGQKLETPKEAAPVNESLPQIWPVVLAAVFLVLVVLGFWKRMGVRS
jgi:cobaltochelatase CobN